MEPILRRGHERSVEFFQERLEQPLILALESHNPSMALELIKRGANVNTLTTHAQRRLHSGMCNDDTATVLDLCRENLRKLREYKPVVHERPDLHYGMDEALAKFQKGTWQYAVVKWSCSSLKTANKINLESYEKERARRLQGDSEEEQGAKLKQDAINSVIATLEEVERELVARNACTFEQLYPDHKRRPIQRHNPSFYWRQPSLEFKADFDIQEAIDVTESKKDKYIEL